MSDSSDSPHSERFQQAIEAIDAANADDPFTLNVDGEELPKEQTHAEMMTRWVQSLDASASEALLLAATRASHSALDDPALQLPGRQNGVSALAVERCIRSMPS